MFFTVFAESGERFISLCHSPNWSEGVERLEHLHDNGATARAFTFKEPFAADGGAYVIDPQRVRSIAEATAAGRPICLPMFSR
nr:DUF3291 domain-containing protein [Rhizobium herbae]